MKYSFVLLTVLWVASLSGCKEEYLIHKKMENNCWMNTDTIRFSLNVKSGGKAPFSIENTYDNNYPFQNIYVKIWAKSPQGKIQEALLLDSLTEYTGAWRVEGGEEVTIPFKTLSPLLFEESGNYSFRMVQFMRKDTLRGVRSVGVIAAALTTDYCINSAINR